MFCQPILLFAITNLYVFLQKVTFAEGAELAASLKVPFCEVSAKTGPVDEAFITLAREAISRVQAVQEGFSLEAMSAMPVKLMSKKTLQVPTCGW